nr:bacteriophage protein [Coxiellaceae bacterium]
MAGMNQHTGKSLTGLAHLQQSIQDILTTPIGSRVMRHDYGSRLFDLIDQPVTPSLTLAIYAATAEAIAKWEPRLLLNNVKLVTQQSGCITLSLTGMASAQLTHPDSDQAVTLSVEVGR